MSSLLMIKFNTPSANSSSDPTIWKIANCLDAKKARHARSVDLARVAGST